MKIPPRMFFLLAGFLPVLLSAQPVPIPLPQAHAHNDYEHARPLLDALENGFCSVEADIFLVDGKLLVAHDLDKVQPERTLEKLYLEPLRERVRRNQGRVYRNGPGFTLLIDIKSEAEPTWQALEQALEPHRDILTKFTPNSTASNAVTVILSGNRPSEFLKQGTPRLAAMDGRIPDLDGPLSVHMVPLISDNWTKFFKWRGQGAIPPEEKIRLRELVNKAHQQGRTIRFWAAPDSVECWRELHEAGADFINTDDLAGLAGFLRSRSPAP